MTAQINESTLQEIVAGYLACAEWADREEGSSARFTKAAKRKAFADCQAFVDSAGEQLVNQALTQPGYSASRFGHDFWLDRCGHGCGFWDRGELENTAADIPMCQDRNGQPYAASVMSDCTIGDALSAVSYGTRDHISRFAHPTLQTYRGWMEFC